MTKSEYIRIAIGRKSYQFKLMIGQRESGKTADLIDFCTFAHPNATKESQGSKCTVYAKKGHSVNVYHYTIYQNYIVRTAANGAKTMFPLN